MSRRLTPEEKTRREAAVEQKRIERENKKKERADKLAKQCAKRQQKADQRAIIQAKILKEKQERERLRADKKAEREFEEKLRQAAVDEALELTLRQVPVVPHSKIWTKDEIAKVKFIRSGMDGLLDQGEDVPPRCVGTQLYDLRSIDLGIYTEEVIKEIAQNGNFSSCVTEHPYGRNNSGKRIIDWYTQNRNVTIEELCTYIEQFIQCTYSTKKENNGPLKKAQNENDLTDSSHWTENYYKAGVKWVYIHSPPDSTTRSAKHVIQCGKLLGIC